MNKIYTVAGYIAVVVVLGILIYLIAIPSGWVKSIIYLKHDYKENV